MHRLLSVLVAVAAPLAAQHTAESADTPLGGPATVDDAGPDAFGFPAALLDAAERRAFAVGNSFFKRNWIQAPASADSRDGLGPLFNARSCSACHFKDGRGAPPDGPLEVPGLLFRLGVAGDAEDPGVPDRPHPRYGGQLQDRAVPGHRPEARITVTEEVLPGSYADGTTFALRRPVVHFTDWDGPPPGPELRVGPRIANQLIGLGLLEAIPERRLRELADPDDRDDDGISGRIHWITTPRGERAIGRFGWKATQATVRDQSAAAFAGDIGITSPPFPLDDRTPAQRDDTAKAADLDLDDHKLDRVAFYCQTLAVPAQRDRHAPPVRRGEALFDAIGCASCHTPLQVTGDDAVIPAYARVAFRPYTDLLLHDMGPELADTKRDGAASPREWRTPPLWGIGLFATVNEHTRYLHDGRAHDLAEAILWHGGEATASREAFRALPRADREDLLRFLRSL